MDSSHDQPLIFAGIPSQLLSLSCRCICHSIPGKNLSKSIVRAVTRPFPWVNSEPRLVHRCNRTDCRLRNADQTRVIVIHSTLLKWAIHTSILLQGLKFKIHPRVYPLVCESS